MNPKYEQKRVRNDSYRYTIAVFRQNGSPRSPMHEFTVDQVCARTVSQLVESTVRDRELSPGNYEIVIFFHYSDAIRRVFVTASQAVVLPPLTTEITN